MGKREHRKIQTSVKYLFLEESSPLAFRRQKGEPSKQWDFELFQTPYLGPSKVKIYPFFPDVGLGSQI